MNVLLTVVTGILFTFFAFASNRWIDKREDEEGKLSARLSSVELRLQRVEDKCEVNK